MCDEYLPELFSLDLNPRLLALNREWPVICLCTTKSTESLTFAPEASGLRD